MTFLLALMLATLISLVFGCSHPIEIVGEGDVYSATGTRNCSYEDYLAGAENCSKNLVVHGYTETYYAEPREGWKFEEWLNYSHCADSGNECAFNIPADLVKNNWGQSVSPLVAVFTRTEPLPPESLGDLVYSREIAPVANGRVWEIAYRSTTLLGEHIIVTGWIARPNQEAPEGGYPVMAFAHGTTGLVGHCAPTQCSTPTITIPLLSNFLARGFVVAATDYQGLSPASEGYHHYLVGPDEARSVLDSVRAARKFTGASADTILFGHSQGGHAVIFANELARTLAPELSIIGTIASGSVVAADFAKMVEYIKQSPYKGYLVMMGLGQNAAYGDIQVPLSTWFTPEGIEAARVMDAICIDELAATFAPLNADDLFVPGAPQPLAGRYDPISDSLPGLRAGSSPLLLIHGRNDPQIRPDFLVPWIEQTCARGQPIEIEWFNTGHRVPYEAPEAVEPVITDWIENRFAGLPVASDCNSIPLP